MVALSLSVRALLLTVLTFAHAIRITHPVEDYAQVFTRADEETIARRIQILATDANVQMAVLTVKTLGGQKIEAYSLRAARAWRGGTSSRDNGLLLVIAPKERRIRLEVGAGLVDKLSDDRVKRILDSAGGSLRMQNYASAVTSIINELDPILRGRPSIYGTAAVAGTALIAAAGVKAATSRAANRDVQPSARSSTAPPPTPSVAPVEDPEAADATLMRQFFLVLSLVCFGLGVVYGRTRLRHDPGASGLLSYMMIIAIAFGISWFVPTTLGNGQLSPSILVVTVVQAISGMRAGMKTHLQRVIGPGDDYELIERAAPGEVVRYALPGVVATLFLGLVMRLPAVHGEQLLAIVGSVVIGVGHAIALNKLQAVIDTRAIEPPGSYTRYCTSPLGRTDNNGNHVHVQDDTTTTTYENDSNSTDNRGRGGSFNGDGASSSW